MQRGPLSDSLPFHYIPLLFLPSTAKGCQLPPGGAYLSSLGQGIFNFFVRNVAKKPPPGGRCQALVLCGGQRYAESWKVPGPDGEGLLCVRDEFQISIIAGCLLAHTARAPVRQPAIPCIPLSFLPSPPKADKSLGEPLYGPIFHSPMDASAKCACNHKGCRPLTLSSSPFVS